MAGYIFSFGKEKKIDELFYVLSKGVFGPNIAEPKNSWSMQAEGTFSDFYSMKQGDHVYFFKERKLYGVAELVKVAEDVKLLNYPKADIPNTFYTQKELDDIAILPDSKDVRMLCTFKASKTIYKNGLDIDYVLQSNPQAFKMLRAFWKLSFIKIDDTEDKALFDILHRVNYLETNEVAYDDSIHGRIQKVVNEEYTVNSNKLIAVAKLKNSELAHEMALEATLVDLLAQGKLEKELGVWDYISHQVVASPFKPIDYMDKMDIFGYSYLSAYREQKTIGEFKVIELKKREASINTVDQVMKYVDWINQEYAFGDFEMIKAYIIAKEIPQKVIDYSKRVAIRNYSKFKPAQNLKWTELALYEYQISEDNSFNLILKE